jgi:Na+/proline symporter/signal transduction histidine kinase/ActR/RegA family two-component response regulator
MLSSWMLITIAVAYVGLLFAIASHGDRISRNGARSSSRPLIYALSLAIYCTSWTFFGSVGLSARSGFDFLPIYIGPILIVAFAPRLIQAVVRISKRQNITSIADFISARYGKNQLLGAVVAVIAMIGVVPYIALQLKAVSGALQVMINVPGGQPGFTGLPNSDELALAVTLAMAAFAWAFGTRHSDATEHQEGMILAVAVESIVKLVAFIIVGAFVTFAMMGGPDQIISQLRAMPDLSDVFIRGIDPTSWVTMTILSMFAIILLPRQFHVMVVENRSLEDVRTARWLFPAYLVAINLFVVPVAAAGLIVFGTADGGDGFVLALPVANNASTIAIIAFLGGLSAATAMVIVETVALSIMVCNNVVLPLLLRRERPGMRDMGRLIIRIRRAVILVVLALAFAYFELLGAQGALAQIGLISFAAIAQFAPAFFIGLVWRRGTAAGAMAGILAGFAAWAYTLILPSLAQAGFLPEGLISQGPFGLLWLRPQQMFGLELDPLSHGVFWSFAANLIGFFAVSMARAPSAVERAQASQFIAPDLPSGGPNFRLWRTSISMGQVRAAVERYLGAERTAQAFETYAQSRGQKFDPAAEADGKSLRFAEHLLASAVGAASSRLIMGLMIERHTKNARGAVRLLDEASAAIQYNRDLLQSAIDNVAQGIAVFDANLSLICWNRQYQALLDLPAEFGRVGVPLHEVVRFMLLYSNIPPSEYENAVNERVRRIAVTHENWQERLNNSVIEVGASEMPDGGVVVTFSDITEAAETAEALEKRVMARTAELTELNHELAQAKVEAEEANIGKTRFIAAASHDILQPLNAARLFTSSLVERLSQKGEGELARNVDQSLESMEEILNALLDMSRLDAGAMRPDISEFRIDEVLSQLYAENEAAARAKGLNIRLAPCSATVRTDRRMLRRMLQNLVSNAVKYTDAGTVLIGCRRVDQALRIEVHDTGSGIPEGKQRAVFAEFERLAQGSGQPGLGLGLSIVDRMAQVLGHKLDLRSRENEGSTFAITVPLARIQSMKTKLAPTAPQAIRPLGQWKLLVIDNEPAILDGMRLLLEGWGLEVITAASAAEAVEVITRHAQDVSIILADYHLHQDDGIILVESLRQRAGRQIPAMLITADRSISVQELAQQQDILYLRKPVKPAALRAALSHAIARLEAPATSVH